MRWLARIERYRENIDEAKAFYQKAADIGDEKAKVELAEIDAGDRAAAATSVPKSPSAPSIPVAQPVPAPTGDDASRAEALFLRKARRFKKNDGRIDKDEKDELRELAEELGISTLRREELIEQVEEEFEPEN